MSKKIAIGLKKGDDKSEDVTYGADGAEDTPEVEEFSGKPQMSFHIGKTSDVFIYKTLNGNGFWVAGDTKPLKLKNYGGKWVKKMQAWLFPMDMRHMIVPLLATESLLLV
jgi:hypothetical protein